MAKRSSAGASVRALFLAYCAAGGVSVAIAVSTSADSEDLYPEREDWQPLSTGTENVSLFVYRDVSRSGSHDRGDPPLAGIAVRLYRPDGSHVVRRSNTHGFVNFSNSLTIPAVDINREGEYRFEALIPQNWKATSGNVIQAARFESRPNTRAGIVAIRPPQPVGLAPLLSISGELAIRMETGELVSISGVRMTAKSPQGRKQHVAIDEHGRFTIDASSGIWTLRALVSESGHQLERSVHVGQVPVRMSAMVLNDPVYPRAPFQKAIDFDAITGSPTTKMPKGPAGLVWTDLVIARKELYQGDGYVNHAVSGDYIGYNSSGYPVTVQHPDGFDFIGAYFGVAWPQANGEILQLRVWRDERLLAVEEFILSSLGPFWLDADYRSVTRLELSTQHYWQFVMDQPRFGFHHTP